MIVLACLINALINVLSFGIWFKTVKIGKLKAYDAKGYFMILVFVILLITFGIGMIGQEEVSAYLILFNTAISLCALTVAFLLIKEPAQY